MNFVIFLRNFDEFLSEFHEELQNITDILDIFTKLPEKFGKCSKFPDFVKSFILLFHCFQSTPYWLHRFAKDGKQRLKKVSFSASFSAS